MSYLYLDIDKYYVRTMGQRHEIKNKLQGETLVRKGLMYERSGVKQ